jgi:hypothetical protein
MKILRITLLAAAVAPLIWILTQRPRVWADRQWAGMALTRGHYRSWSVSFCDGFRLDESGMVPVVIENGKVRDGYFSSPRFAHCAVPPMR